MLKLAAKKNKKSVKHGPDEREEAATKKVELGSLGLGLGTLALMFSRKQPKPKDMPAYAYRMQREMGKQQLPGKYKLVAVHTPFNEKGRGEMLSWQAPGLQISPFYSGHEVPNFLADDPKSAKPLVRRFANIPGYVRDSIIAHEFGHALNDQAMQAKGKWIHTPYRIGEMASRTLAIPEGMAALRHAARDEDPSYKPALQNLLIQAPMLAEEAAASLRAVKFLTAKHGLKTGLWKSAPLLAAFGTYALPALAPLAVTAARKRVQANEAKEKKAQFLLPYLPSFADETERIATQS